MTGTTKCGYVALLGKPNVGKSTLLNQILGQKISIISRKAQTTRHQILGIKTEEQNQVLYVDTPGIHKSDKTFNKALNREACRTLTDVDVIVWLLDNKWTEQEDHILEKIKTTKLPVIAAINKIDLMPDKTKLLPYLQQIHQVYDFQELIPISAQKGHGITQLEQIIANQLPEGPWLFESEQVTDRSQRFLAGELVREQLMRHLGDELPYGIAVVVESFQEDRPGFTSIDASIIVAKNSHKAMVIGKGGSMLREVGRLARMNLNRQLESRVHLQLWVKVKAGWTEDPQLLREFSHDQT